MKGATYADLADSVTPEVSIHAPNEGSDQWLAQQSLIRKVSIHAPNEGSDDTFA